MFHRGEDQLAEDRFGNQTKPHKFCPNCGTSVLINFKESPCEQERERMLINGDCCFRTRLCLAWYASVVSECTYGVLMEFQIHTIRGIEDVLDELDYRAVDGKNRLGTSVFHRSGCSTVTMAIIGIGIHGSFAGVKF
ncbi:hypothetical protein BDV38DRAFT_44187 [Aspergillus pseudotamarii]|uniref:CENP-V/GFA domain-containing protein n=1 Tax=Aspergillus pseudotamarii TaxID=132259 RepID=A0A5N6SXY9_ASPPS|nr:uncharacterized protein BDV38DRAFT_44187 [Aspergillus pseudotamarii]KAE8139492.1 hypothetical protein BDV38DRAFT_44187 [Aspergillus pseudotamarii]